MGKISREASEKQRRIEATNKGTVKWVTFKIKAASPNEAGGPLSWLIRDMQFSGPLDINLCRYRMIFLYSFPPRE